MHSAGEGQPQLHSELEVSLGYMTPCLKTANRPDLWRLGSQLIGKRSNLAFLTEAFLGHQRCVKGIMGTCSFSFVPASEVNGFAALCTLVMMLPQTYSNGANQSCAETSQIENPNKPFYKLAISGIFL